MDWHYGSRTASGELPPTRRIGIGRPDSHAPRAPRTSVGLGPACCTRLAAGAPGVRSAADLPFGEHGVVSLAKGKVGEQAGRPLDLTVPGRSRHLVLRQANSGMVVQALPGSWVRRARHLCKAARTLLKNGPRGIASKTIRAADEGTQ